MNVWGVLACTAIIELVVLRRLRFDWFTVAIVLAGTVLCANYLAYTQVGERNYDGPAHIEYIRWIAHHGRPPEVRACGVCGHPPLYYALAALWSHVVGGWMPFELGLQWLSLLLFFGFVVFALRIIQSCATRSSTVWLAAALVVFWPSSILNSVRVHNDALASFLIVAGMYFIAMWDRHERARDFYAALAATALALLTKSTGYAAAATLVLFAALRLRTPPRRDSVRRLAIAILVLASVGAGAVGFRDTRNPTSLCQKVLGNACGGRYVPLVPDQPSRFLVFDVADFVQRDDSLPVDPGRDYFLNRLAKSSLFGVIPLGDAFGGKRHQVLGLVIRILFLAMAAVCLGALPFLRGIRLRPYRAYLGAVVILFVFLVAFRIRLPNEFHEDFRHIFPALVPLCLGYAALVERIERVSKAFHFVSLAIGLATIASSVAFFARIP